MFLVIIRFKTHTVTKVLGPFIRESTKFWLTCTSHSTKTNESVIVCFISPLKETINWLAIQVTIKKWSLENMAIQMFESTTFSWKRSYKATQKIIFVFPLRGNCVRAVFFSSYVKSNQDLKNLTFFTCHQLSIIVKGQMNLLSLKNYHLKSAK